MGHKHCMKNILFLALIVLFASCKKNNDNTATRSYRMGFMNSAPRFDDTALMIASLNLWTTRADAAIISTEVPWDELLAGGSAAIHVNTHYKDLAAFYRSKNLALWVYIDPQNGLDRTSDAVPLVKAGKSISQPDVQEKYRQFVIAMDSILKPDHLGLALETNLIRFASPASIYSGVKKAVNDVAAALKQKNTKAKLSVSVQVEMAWGLLAGVPYQGIATDLTDFPFIEEIGLSSYPYFSFDKPSDIPNDYYSKVLAGNQLPVFVCEGGWTSKSVNTPIRNVVSSDDIQKEYIKRHDQLLQSINATALFQLTFTDIDLNALPPTVPATIGFFTNLGLVNINMQPKPSLTEWDKLFKKPLRQ